MSTTPTARPMRPAQARLDQAHGPTPRRTTSATGTRADRRRRERRDVRTDADTTGPSGPDELELGRRLVDGDEDAIRELYDRHAAQLFAVAYRTLRERRAAEDVVQEVLIRVWRRRATFDTTRPIEPWLFRIARNTTYDLVRAAARRPRSAAGDPADTLASVAAGRALDDPATTTERMELTWAVRAAIDALPVGEREVVRCQHLAGLSHHEVAQRLGISIGTVKSRSHRAHRRLAAALADR